MQIQFHFSSKQRVYQKRINRKYYEILFDFSNKKLFFVMLYEWHKNWIEYQIWFSFKYFWIKKSLQKRCKRRKFEESYARIESIESYPHKTRTRKPIEIFLSWIIIKVSKPGFVDIIENQILGIQIQCLHNIGDLENSYWKLNMFMNIFSE